MTQCIAASIIVPAWNEAKIIRKTLRRITNITVTVPTEVILVAGGVDETYEICKEWTNASNKKFEDRVCLLQDTGDGKMGALKKGFSACKGNYILLLDADTLVPNNWLERIMEELQTYDAVSCNYEPKNRHFIISSQVLINKWASIATKQKFLAGWATIGIRWKTITDIGIENLYPSDRNLPVDDIYLNLALKQSDKEIGPLVPDVTVETHSPTNLFQLYRKKVRWNSARYELNKGNRKNLLTTFLYSGLVSIGPLGMVFLSLTVGSTTEKDVLLTIFLLTSPFIISMIIFLKNRVSTVKTASRHTNEAWLWLPQFLFVEYVASIAITSAYFQRFLGSGTKIEQFTEKR